VLGSSSVHSSSFSPTHASSASGLLERTWPIVLGRVACVRPYAPPVVRKALARSRPLRSPGVRLSVGYVSVGNNALTTSVSYRTYTRQEMGSYDELLESNTFCQHLPFHFSHPSYPARRKTNLYSPQNGPAATSTESYRYRPPALYTHHSPYQSPAPP
jgi:hypothetical protein